MGVTTSAASGRLGHDASILIVDDNALSARKLELALNAFGYSSVVAEGGKAGLTAMRAGHFDLVLLDIVMPDIDGFGVLAAMQADARLRHLPVIVISAIDRETDTVARAITRGAVDFLPRNFDPAILRARIEATLTRKRFHDREAAYFADVDKIIAAAGRIERGSFRPEELDLDAVAGRDDPIGQLADVFRDLANRTFEREYKLDRVFRTLRGTLLVLAAGAIFGAVPSLGRIAASLEVPALGLVIWANLFGATLCLALAFWRGGKPNLRWAHLPFLAVWALILGCLYNLLTAVIASRVEATTIALVCSSRGFMVFGLAALVALEPASLRRVLGLGLGFGAVVALLLVNGSVDGAADGVSLAATLILPFLLALHTLLMSWRPKDLDAFTAVGCMMALSAVLLAPFVLSSDSMIWPSLDIGPTEQTIMALGAAASLAVVVALEVVKTAGPVFGGQMAYSQTIFGILWGYLLLGETLSNAAWVALVVVIIGFLFVEPKSADATFRARFRLPDRAGSG